MRLDKYLKLSKLIKRRPVANLMCDEGKIKIDDRTGKASSNVKEGQILELDMGRKKIKVKVLLAPDKLFGGMKPADLYEIIEEIWINEI
jgi:ribosomal 50S subunit-recycling heat shock protein